MEGGVRPSGEAADGDVVPVATEAGDVLVRPLDREPLVPEPEVPKRLARSARFLHQLTRSQEAKDVEPVRRRHEDAAHLRLGEERGGVLFVR